MFPYINFGPVHLGTFGLLLWLAAVVGTIVLHKNFVRNGVDADALSVVAFVVIAGVIGAKTWHELQNVTELKAGDEADRRAGVESSDGCADGLSALVPGGVCVVWRHAGGDCDADVAGAVGTISGAERRTLGEKVGALRMLDLAAPAAAIGYGVGRIGCLLSGDGDYGIKTTLPWGVHMKPDALVPTADLVQPTPVYELVYSVVLAWWLWQRGKKHLPVSVITGEYLVLSGIGRFLVEFVRMNPRLYWG